MKTTVLLTPFLLSSLRPREREFIVHDAGCKGLAIRVQPGGSMSWVCWHREEGKTRRITLGKLEAMGLEDARDAFHIFRTAGTSPVKRPVRSGMTFAALCEAFLAAKQGRYTDRTLSCLGYYLDTQLLPTFRHTDMSAITPAQVADWFHTYSRTRPGGANQALGHFTTIVNWGKRNRVLDPGFANPAAPLRFNPRRAKGRMLNGEQLARLAAVLNSAQPVHKEAADAIWLILLTGCRSGEILRLRWDEVKRDRLKLALTKTGPRDVLLSTAALQHLEVLRKRRRSDYVFPSRRSDKPHRTSIDGTWKTLKRLAALPPGIRLHDLRHTYASHAILSGETLSMTSKLLGHSSLHSTQRYAHLDEKHLAKAAGKIAARISEMLEAGEI